MRTVHIPIVTMSESKDPLILQNLAQQAIIQAMSKGIVEPDFILHKSGAGNSYREIFWLIGQFPKNKPLHWHWKDNPTSTRPDNEQTENMI